MTTARQLITRSFRLIRVKQEGQDLPASYVNDGLEIFNEMLHALKAENADLGFQDIGLDDELPLPPEHVRALRYMLAVELAPEYGSELTPEVALNAKESKDTLKAHYFRIGTLKTDPALQDRRWRNRYYDGEEIV